VLQCVAVCCSVLLCVAGVHKVSTIGSGLKGGVCVCVESRMCMCGGVCMFMCLCVSMRACACVSVVCVCLCR